MNENHDKFGYNYLALMLGLGVNPMATRKGERRYDQRIYSPTNEKVILTAHGLVCSWDKNGRMRWTKK